jgi:hypothetical protein
MPAAHRAAGIFFSSLEPVFAPSLPVVTGRKRPGAACRIDNPTFKISR